MARRVLCADPALALGRPARAPLRGWRERVRDGKDVAQVCVWLAGFARTTKVWAWLKQKKCPVLARVQKVSLVRQRDGVARIDLFASPAAAGAQLVAWLRTVGRGWLVRESRPFGLRRRHPRAAAAVAAARARGKAKADAASVPSAERLAAATLNVSTLRETRALVAQFVRDAHLGVLALQETKLTADGWPFRVEGCQVFHHPVGDASRGQHGVALVVDERLLPVSTLVTPYSVWVRMDTVLPVPLFVASVYIPVTGTKVHRAVQRQVCAEAERFLRSGEVCLLGDFNQTPERLDARLAQLSPRLGRLEVMGSDLSWERGGRTSAIDHVVGSRGALDLLRSARVHRVVDLSDHWPVVTRRSCSTNAYAWLTVAREQARRPRAPAALSPEQLQQFADHNVWSALEEAGDEEARRQEDDGEGEGGDGAHGAGGVTPLALSHALETALGAAAAAAPKPAAAGARARQPSLRPVLSRDMRNQLRRQRQLGRVVRALRARLGVHNARVQRRRRAYAALVATNQLRLRAEAKQGWFAHLAKGAQRLARAAGGDDGADADAGGDARDRNAHPAKVFWQWARSVATGADGARRGGRRSVTGLVIRDRRGRLTADPRRALRIWHRHFRRLYRDDTGRSRDAERWADGAALARRWPRLPGLNGAFSEEELRVALRGRPAGRAPGMDGVSAELLRQCFPCPEEGGLPRTTRLLLQSLNTLLEQPQLLPEAWKDAAVVPIPKPHKDPTVLDNYRGIALLSTLSKVLGALITRRVARALEAAGRLTRAQAGFRRGQECLSHVVLLDEVIRRRRAVGLPTFVLFLDLRKAYDMVPHAGLLSKLAALGVRGRLWRLVQALYQGLRLWPCVGGICADEGVPQQRGVRQGAVESPVFFNAFINDFFEESEACADGVAVPGLRRGVPGGLWADDAFVLAGSAAQLTRCVRRADAWAAANGMEYGVEADGSKSAVMAVGVPRAEAERLRTARGWRLGGTALPVVAEYRHLGVMVNDELDLARVAGHRARKVEQALHALGPALRNALVPAGIKLQLVRCLLVPVCRWAGELLGMQQQRAVRVHRALTQALRWCYGLPASCNQVALYAEAGLRPVHVLWTAQRARAWVKYRGAPTWASTVLKRPLAGRGGLSTWAVATRHYARRFLGLRLEEYAPSEARQVYKEALAAGWRSWCRRREKRRGAWWRLGGFARSASDVYRADPTRCPTVGSRVLWQLRQGHFLGAHLLARSGKVAAEFAFECPACGQSVPETLAHLLVECARWQRPRRAWLEPLWRQLGAAGLPARTRAVLCLGGALGRMAAPTLRALAKRRRRRAANGVALGPGPAQRVPWVYATARFLAAVWRPRQVLLSELAAAHAEEAAGAAMPLLPLPLPLRAPGGGVLAGRVDGRGRGVRAALMAPARADAGAAGAVAAAAADARDGGGDGDGSEGGGGSDGDDGDAGSAAAAAAAGVGVADGAGGASPAARSALAGVGQRGRQRDRFSVGAGARARDPPLGEGSSGSSAAPASKGGGAVG